jgi:hypothetical protein
LNFLDGFVRIFPRKEFGNDGFNLSSLDEIDHLQKFLLHGYPRSAEDPFIVMPLHGIEGIGI